ncbi:transcriptional repressor [uncultured Bacteroides sp.]|jgi:Fur family ferric uptake transcriptional regulator|uniref:Fur family transcriptional regulator n=1 Tax=uncultured Bacteroides sp. TaxID=162156 RepID=UPI0025D4DF49|nr:transcriptional repressor [uncultured Bacteroides sp.]
MSETELEISNIEHVLKDASIRPTSIRIMVLKEIISYDTPFTLAEMEDRLDTLDKSTLFRTLTLFLHHHILHEIDNGSGSKLYCRCVCSSSRHASHLHFTCISCHKTFCIKNIDCSQIPRPENFEIMEINCVMKGLCPDCKCSYKNHIADERSF